MTPPLWLLNARAFAKRIPTWAYIVAASLMLLLTAYCVGKGDGKDTEQAKQAVTERKALERARKADAASQAQVKETTGHVEQGNQRAREAASSGPDPLRDGFNSLRAEARSSPASR
jgi:hypothetical protein